MKLFDQSKCPAYQHFPSWRHRAKHTETEMRYCKAMYLWLYLLAYIVGMGIVIHIVMTAISRFPPDLDN